MIRRQLWVDAVVEEALVKVGYKTAPDLRNKPAPSENRDY
jgi:hypothetical protein